MRLPSEPFVSTVFNTDLCIVELVGADNRPVTPGAPSAKVLVTNLYNVTQPLIRYELTDRLLRHPDAPDHGHLRATAEGRADDTFRYGSVEVHPLAIRTVMVKTPQVREYEVRQTESGADVAVVLDRELDQTALAADLEESLGNAGVPEPRVTVRVVDHIPRHAQTGKSTRFISLPR